MTIKSTAKYLIFCGYFSRYELVLKAVSKIISLDKHTIYYDQTYNHDDDTDESHYDFVVSENLTTPGNGYRTFHNWFFHKFSGLHDFDI